MSDVLDSVLILGILLVLVWLGFVVMAVQWVAEHAVTVFGSVVLLIGAAVVWTEYRRH